MNNSKNNMLESEDSGVVNFIKKYAILCIFLLVIIFFQVRTKGVLLQPMNINSLIQQNSYILVLAIGMLLVILTGNIDLSVGSIVAYSSAICAHMIVNVKTNIPQGTWVMLGMLVALLIGAVAGAWNGLWISYFKIPAFIVTLSSQLVFRGLAQGQLKGKTIAPFPDSYTFISSKFLSDAKINIAGTEFNTLTLIVGIVCVVAVVAYQFYSRSAKKKAEIHVSSNGAFYLRLLLTVAIIIGFTYLLGVFKGIPSVLTLLLALIAIYGFITTKTIPGRHIYALGGNEKAARLSGINTKSVMFWVYVNMGVIAALAGIVFSGRLNAATPQAGDGFELDAIASCYIGGASSSGGIGTVFGAIIGGLLMGVLNNGMSISGVPVHVQLIVKGLVLLFAVAFDVITKSKSSKS